MSSEDRPAVPLSTAWPAALVRSAPALFAVTLFLSALLLFAVQPMFTKMVLPRLGGSPSVWSVAMVFFQSALLAGYAYAHLLVRTVPVVRAAFVHMLMLAAAAATLPISLAAGYEVPPEHGVALWVVGLFAASIGLPFMALSASAPLLQSWYAASGHRGRENPYVLYAASNLGSFVGLIAYPFLMEPLLPLRDQARWWSVGFAALAVLVAIAGLTSSGEGAAGFGGARSRLLPGERTRWLALAAIPSGLVVAVTAHLTTDVAAAPFLWVVPLALYLMTFVAVFRDRPWLSHETVVRYAPFVLAPLAVSVIGSGKVFWIALILLDLVGFVMLTLVCHSALYCRRPPADRLTEFYLWVSVGGVLGGIFAGLVAPNLFNGTYEYPILIGAGLLVLPGALMPWRGFLRETAPALVIAGAVLIARFGFDVRLPLAAEVPMQVALVALAAWMLFARARPARFFSLAVLAFIVGGAWHPGVAVIEKARSFFGVHEVADTTDGTHRFLFHGTTIHGVEPVRRPDGVPLTDRPQPVSYYYPGGPYSEAFDAARKAQHGLSRVAIVGLGAGIVSCHRRDGEAWTFFEIDPEVVRIARDTRLFRSLSQCAPDAEIVLGDARLTLTASRRQYDLIALDAFTSDAIPVHLLTGEAFAGYLRHLSPHGMLIAHISNRHMDLAPVIAATGAAQNLVVYFRQDDTASAFLTDYHANAHVAVLARDVADLGDLPQRPGWRRLEPVPGIHGWTDDYSDLIGAILRRKLAE